MPKSPATLQADVVVAGSGPGGAATARELSRRGKKVILCEAGAYHHRFGYTPFLLSMMEKFGLTLSREGTWVLIPKTVGGASVVFCGTAFRPPPWLKEKYGIDLSGEVEELFREIPIQPLPDRLIGSGAQKIMGAALAEEILVKAGVRREKIFKTAVLASHPGGTVRIGRLLDKDCQTPIENCFCLDTTIIPEPWGLPPSVTVVAMAKRLAKKLTTS
jgi:choline dehydrogenase-like flavoprotein